MIKSAHEIALMRLASQVTLAAYEAVYHALREGMTQQQVGDLIAAAYDNWAFPAKPACRSTNTPPCLTARATPQIIHEGSIIMIDDGCTSKAINPTSPAPSCSAKLQNAGTK